MPRVVVTPGAVRGLEQCRRFLDSRNPPAAARAGECIVQHFELLETHPEIGRPRPDQPELRELPMAFGDSGYVALYRYVPEEGVVYILAFKHQKEVGYRLGLHAGDRIDYVLDAEGRFLILPATRHVDELAGILRRPGAARPVSLDEMDAAIRDGAIGR